ncbi:hypothetical protein M3204_15030 [Mesobacillus subterraneus]|jgi:hypothetical protein|uniref:hypothetical protein n=1 Tax=Mesobacillus subterraneus TaxID=285983 RepID=UPI00203C667D|nr:hypothetical protein [Mesobacillus subterraneus]MCM3665730.1 hypothetical protein [Mesobacillus subterraneus]MCM3684475.1 hypothetical protein [Mesobacillus subterraneus]
MEDKVRIRGELAGKSAGTFSNPEGMLTEIRKAQAPWSAPTSAGGPTGEVVL